MSQDGEALKAELDQDASTCLRSEEKNSFIEFTHIIREISRNFDYKLKEEGKKGTGARLQRTKGEREGEEL